MPNPPAHPGGNLPPTLPALPPFGEDGYAVHGNEPGSPNSFCERVSSPSPTLTLCSHIQPDFHYGDKEIPRYVFDQRPRTRGGLSRQKTTADASRLSMMSTR
jgi:hypothetical protein